MKQLNTSELQQVSGGWIDRMIRILDPVDKAAEDFYYELITGRTGGSVNNNRLPKFR
ncbi:bacteriocin [Neisseria sp. 83E34]|uniref:bacteriocin n=1 Tax=Neisseria sp. 83E34 TaxID=1692264 RepID=UPI000A662357